MDTEQARPPRAEPLADRETVRTLLDRLLYTRNERERQRLLAEIKSEIQTIRTLADF